MDTNTVIGLVILPLAVGALTALVWWSKKRIDSINDAGPASARAILRSQNGESDV